MKPAVVASWRAFYRKAVSGEAGYTITPTDYRRLYVAQKGRCWICRKARGVHPDDPAGRGSRRLGVDHNHVTGAVRGLLCTGGDKTCNRIIGWLDAAALQRAADYVSSPPARALAVVERDRLDAALAGVQLTETELDDLAHAVLWPEDVSS